MKIPIDLRGRAFAMGAIVLFLAACASGTTSPGTPSGASIAAKVKPATACGSGIGIGPGDNGTYSLAVGSTCDMTAPADTGCTPDEQSGTSYIFSVQSGGSHGILTPMANTATFKRTSAGDVVIEVEQLNLNAARNCNGTGSAYGHVTLD